MFNHYFDFSKSHNYTSSLSFWEHWREKSFFFLGKYHCPLQSKCLNTWKCILIKILWLEQSLITLIFDFVFLLQRHFDRSQRKSLGKKICLNMYTLSPKYIIRRVKARIGDSQLVVNICCTWPWSSISIKA